MLTTVEKAIYQLKETNAKKLAYCSVIALLRFIDRVKNMIGSLTTFQSKYMYNSSVVGGNIQSDNPTGI